MACYVEIKVIPGKIKPDWSGRGAYSFTMAHLLIVYLILQLHSIKTRYGLKVLDVYNGV